MLHSFTYFGLPTMSKPVQHLHVLLLLYLGWRNFCLSRRHLTLSVCLFALHHFFAQLSKFFFRFPCFYGWSHALWSCVNRHLGRQSLILFDSACFICLPFKKYHMLTLFFIFENFNHCTFRGFTDLSFVFCEWLDDNASRCCYSSYIFRFIRNSFYHRVTLATHFVT